MRTFNRSQLILAGLLSAILIFWLLRPSHNDGESVPPPKPRKISFNDLFEHKDHITLVGDSLTPLLSTTSPLIIKDKIYVCDYLGHYVAIYSTTGRMMKRIGKKGKGPQEFQMPYGVDVDVEDNLYVNDRGNMRVHVYDPALTLLKTISLSGQSEAVFVRKTGEKPNIVTIGAAPCRDGQCLVQEYDWGGRLVNAFAPYVQPFIIHTWVAFQDVQGRLFLSNILEQQVSAFDLKGRLIQKIKLASPSMRFLKTNVNPDPESTAELRAGLRILKEEEHTRVRRIFVTQDYVLILFELMRKEQEPMFILDVYEEKGNLLFYGVETPGELCWAAGQFYIVREKATDSYGLIELERLQFKLEENLYLLQARNRN